MIKIQDVNQFKMIFGINLGVLLEFGIFNEGDESVVEKERLSLGFEPCVSQNTAIFLAFSDDDLRTVAVYGQPDLHRARQLEARDEAVRQQPLNDRQFQLHVVWVN